MSSNHRKSKQRDEDVPLFDPEFQKLMEMDPDGKNSHKISKEEDEPDVIIGHTPRGTYAKILKKQENDDFSINNNQKPYVQTNFSLDNDVREMELAEHDEKNPQFAFNLNKFSEELSQITNETNQNARKDVARKATIKHDFSISKQQLIFSTHPSLTLTGSDAIPLRDRLTFGSSQSEFRNQKSENLQFDERKIDENIGQNDDDGITGNDDIYKHFRKDTFSLDNQIIDEPKELHNTVLPELNTLLGNDNDDTNNIDECEIPFEKREISNTDNDVKGTGLILRTKKSSHSLRRKSNSQHDENEENEYNKEDIDEVVTQNTSEQNDDLSVLNKDNKDDSQKVDIDEADLQNSSEQNKELNHTEEEDNNDNQKPSHVESDTVINSDLYNDQNEKAITKNTDFESKDINDNQEEHYKNEHAYEEENPEEENETSNEQDLVNVPKIDTKMAQDVFNKLTSNEEEDINDAKLPSPIINNDYEELGEQNKDEINDHDEDNDNQDESHDNQNEDNDKQDEDNENQNEANYDQDEANDYQDEDNYNQNETNDNQIEYKDNQDDDINDIEQQEPNGTEADVDAPQGKKGSTSKPAPPHHPSSNPRKHLDLVHRERWKNPRSIEPVYVKALSGRPEPQSPKRPPKYGEALPDLRASEVEPALGDLSLEILGRLERVSRVARQHFPGTFGAMDCVAKLADKGVAARDFDEVDGRFKLAEFENVRLRLLLESDRPARPHDPREAARLQRQVAEAERKIRRLQGAADPTPRFVESDEVRAAKIEHSHLKSQVGALQEHVDELKRRLEELERRIKLMTQKKSNYAYGGVHKKSKRRKNRRTEASGSPTSSPETKKEKPALAPPDVTEILDEEEEAEENECREEEETFMESIRRSIRGIIQ